MPAPSVIWLCGPDAGGTLGYDESGGSCDESLMCLWSSVLGLYGPTLVTSPHPAAAIASGARRSSSAGDATVGPGRRTRTTTTVTAPSSATIIPMRRVHLARTIFRCNAARSRRACVRRSAFVTRPPVGSLFAIKVSRPGGKSTRAAGTSRIAVARWPSCGGSRPFLCSRRLPRINEPWTCRARHRASLGRGWATEGGGPRRRGTMTAMDTRARGGGLQGYFHLRERGTDVRTEVIAGLATWLTMAYILVVNAQILTALPDRDGTVLPFDQVVTSTALVAGVMTLAYGIFTNYPFAMAAGLGLNAFVAFTLVGTAGLSWPEAMGVIVLEGLIIAALVLTGFREAVLNAIPMDLKRAIGIGIGLFIAFIGFDIAGIVIHPESGAPILTLNPDLTTLRIATFAIGLAVTGSLVALRVRGALLIGIILTTIVASIINAFADPNVFPPGVATWPESVVDAPDFSLVGNFSLDLFDGQTVAVVTTLALILSVMLSDFFDTMGTVIGVGGEAGLLTRDGKLPGIQRVLFVDSLGAALGGATSSSSNTTYIESAAGVSEGGRTGLTAVVVGVLFLLAMFLAPLPGVVPTQATAPVLVIVGYFMMKVIKDIDWRDPGAGIPILLTIIVMPFTFSITNGVGAGFLSYTVIQVLRGRWNQVHWLLYVVSAVFLWYFIEGLVPLG